MYAYVYKHIYKVYAYSISNYLSFTEWEIIFNMALLMTFLMPIIIKYI